ncbi:hypothetical protein FEM08_34090 [Flavobacterium gilvum]|nr:hypothetical protein FEM08_34090 [Flavobacterium gilvum]
MMMAYGNPDAKFKNGIQYQGLFSLICLCLWFMVYGLWFVVCGLLFVPNVFSFFIKL